jgi:23S rRNA (adenine2503-C2)-methyltransferase
MNRDLPNIRHLSLGELTEYFEGLGEKKFRIQQVHEWLWQKHAHSFDDMTNLSKELRAKLNETFILPALTIDKTQVSEDGTVKSRRLQFKLQILRYRNHGPQKKFNLRRNL